jgi:hypothetical protein
MAGQNILQRTLAILFYLIGCIPDIYLQPTKGSTGIRVFQRCPGTAQPVS